MLNSMVQPELFFLMKKRWWFKSPQPPLQRGDENANLKLVQKVGAFAMFEIVAENNIFYSYQSLKQEQYYELRKSCILTCWILASF